MRRPLTLLFSASLLVVACGGSDSDAGPGDTVDPAAATADTPVATDDAAPSTDAPPTTELAPPPTNPDKPTDIDVPGEEPSDLVVTVIEPGTGPAAEEGDTVIVDYVGVRSLDGVEFDNSYDRNTPYSVGPLGAAPVIQGWNEGLLEAQTGARLQLDIPSDLAYGPTARSEIIRENEPLTFVIDVRSVIKVSDPADAPTETGVEPSEGATELSFEDLIEGDGAELVEGQTAIFHLVLFRADNGVELDTTWQGEPIQLPITEGGFPAIVQGMPGMHVGGRRAITAPPELGFGVEGNPQIGLPAGTDMVIVVDLLGAY